MTIIQVQMSDGYPVTINGAKDEADATARAEADINAPHFVGEKQAASLAAESEGYFYADGGFLVKTRKIAAVGTRRMREVYMSGGYCNVPLGEFLPVAA